MIISQPGAAAVSLSLVRCHSLEGVCPFRLDATACGFLTILVEDARPALWIKCFFFLSLYWLLFSLSGDRQTRFTPTVCCMPAQIITIPAH